VPSGPADPYAAAIDDLNRFLTDHQLASLPSPAGSCGPTSPIGGVQIIAYSDDLRGCTSFGPGIYVLTGNSPQGTPVDLRHSAAGALFYFTCGETSAGTLSAKPCGQVTPTNPYTRASLHSASASIAVTGLTSAGVLSGGTLADLAGLALASDPELENDPIFGPSSGTGQTLGSSSGTLNVSGVVYLPSTGGVSLRGLTTVTGVVFASSLRPNSSRTAPHLTVQTSTTLVPSDVRLIQ
jgi:hypothetical protein